MTVIWMILKTAGIALLVILGLLLAALLAVLFVPVRYRADGSWREELTASAAITWLLHLVSIRIAYEKELSVRVSVCGIRIKTGKKAEPTGSGQRTAAASAPESAAASAPEPASESESETAAKPDAGTIPGAMPETAPEAQAAGGQENPKAPDTAKAPEPGKDPESAQDKRRFSFDALKKRLSAAWRKLQGSLRNIRGTAKRLYRQFIHYKAIWDREETRQAFHLASAQLCRTLRHVLPRRINVRAAVGTGDPASTGQVLAVQGILYPWLGDKVQIVPDFEERRFEGEFHLKGQLRAGVVGFYALRLMLDKNVRRLIGILRGRTADKEDHNGRKQGQ